MTCSIIWQGNPISVVKPFATKNCALCAKERIAALKQFRSNPQLLINSNNLICGACKHRPRFHRYVKQTTPSTDESINDERASCQRASCATYRQDPCTLLHERLPADSARSQTMQRHWDDLKSIAQQELTLSIFHAMRSLIRLVFITSHLAHYSTMTSLDL